MKIAFYTLGCKVNQYETQALSEAFQKRGYEVVGEQETADIYVVNTCTVTGLSDRKSRQYIRRRKRENPDCITCVIGCYAQVSPEEAAAIEGVNIVAGTNEKSRLPEYVEQYLAEREGCAANGDTPQDGGHCHIKEYDGQTPYEETGVITSMESRTRAFLKIQEGCSQFCTYCIIPYARGAMRSRALEDVVKEAKSLIDRGFKELVLTGINTALYGMEPGFSASSRVDTGQKDSEGAAETIGSILGGAAAIPDDILEESTAIPSGILEEERDAISGEKTDSVWGIEAAVQAVAAIPGEFRIRLGSLEPNVVNAHYVERLMKYDKLCPHMHLSLQSGSDRILADMNRHYSREEYEKIVEVLRKKDPGYGISADVIVGFPGEKEEDFMQSADLVRRSGLCRTHVFPYSPRKGTPAAEMKEQVSPQVKKERSQRLIAVGEEAAQEFHRSLEGTVRTVLLEEYDPQSGYCRGYADNYVRVYCPPLPEQSEEDCLNQFFSVRLLSPWKEGMLGCIQKNPIGGGK